MATIEAPARTGLGDHVDWMLHRPEMAQGYGALADGIYGHTRLTVREREAARYVIALINDCAVCRATRVDEARGTPPAEPYYAAVADWRESADLSDRERLVAEFAERFVLDHERIHGEFWERLTAVFEPDEVADLTMCCGAFLGMGRALAVAGVAAPVETLRM